MFGLIFQLFLWPFSEFLAVTETNLYFIKKRSLHHIFLHIVWLYIVNTGLTYTSSVPSASFPVSIEP